jgi:hypothetical protein
MHEVTVRFPWWKFTQSHTKKELTELCEFLCSSDNLEPTRWEGNRELFEKFNFSVFLTKIFSLQYFFKQRSILSELLKENFQDYQYFQNIFEMKIRAEYQKKYWWIGSPETWK